MLEDPHEETRAQHQIDKLERQVEMLQARVLELVDAQFGSATARRLAEEWLYPHITDAEVVDALDD